MTFIYLLVAAVGYHALGNEHAEYLQKWADKYKGDSAATTVANLMLAIHVLTGYAINGNVFNRTLLNLLVPTDRHNSRFAWSGVASLTLGASFVAANLVPGLDGLLSLIGSVCGTSLTFLIPASCALKLFRDTMGKGELVLHGVVIAMALFLLVFGTYSAGLGLKEDYNQSTHPFSCGTGKRGTAT
jgi:hypothetical protein